jgi:hypothetical protein
MRAGTSGTGVVLIVIALLVGAGCASGVRDAGADPPKVAAMRSLLRSLRRDHPAEDEQVWYDVTISPTVSDGSRIQYAFESAYGHRLVWSEDTIAASEVATLVETVKRSERITGVGVFVYHWYRGRWISTSDLTRELYPAEVAALEAMFDGRGRRTTRAPATRSVR